MVLAISAVPLTSRPAEGVFRLRKRTRARECALQILYQMDITGDHAGVVLARFWQSTQHESEVREFATQLVRGTSEDLAEIDALIVEHSENWEIGRMAAIDRSIMRLAIYELLHRSDIPPKVSVNEAVELAHKYSTPDSGKFINGILDKAMDSKPASAIDL